MSYDDETWYTGWRLENLQMHLRFYLIYISIINLSSPKGGCTNPLTVLALVLKIAQPRGKIAPGTFQVHPFPSF